MQMGHKLFLECHCKLHQSIIAIYYGLFSGIFSGTLKKYQLKGMNWLLNLYDQGINGILADEMGLGKTVQALAMLAHIAEHYNIWGPFLVVTPASTLHNWQQEVCESSNLF